MRHRLLASAACALLAGPALAQGGFGLDPLRCIAEGVFKRPPRAPAVITHGPAETGLEMPVYEGATPPGLDPSRPVLVLVQGLHGSARDWWDDTEYYGHNDMYDAVYAAGYKAFFVDLWDARGGDQAEDGIDNGKLLKSQIDWIAGTWGVGQVNVIAHSKGGIDSNIAALMGAPIDSLATLSSPHYGSPLSDLAQTDWLDWLADLLGFNDAGTKFLQTGCMRLVRDQADVMPGNADLHIFTFAANDWGPNLSALWWGGSYLWLECPEVDIDGDGHSNGFEGENDGLVCDEHARHPLSRDPADVQTGGLRQIWDIGEDTYMLDHDSVRMGNQKIDFFWWWQDDCWVEIFAGVEPYVAVHRGLGGLPAPARGETPPLGSPAMRQLLRGGPIAGGEGLAGFPVEASVETLLVSALVSGPEVRLSLVGPDGRVVAAPAPRPAGSEIFRGAWATAVVLPRPATGAWQARFTGGERGAFALAAGFAGGAQLQLELPGNGILRSGSDLTLRAAGAAAAGAEIRVIGRRTSTATAAMPIAAHVFSGAGPHRLRFERPGVYNLQVVVTGRTGAGSPFERSQVVSVAVADAAPRGDLPPACR